MRYLKCDFNPLILFQCWNRGSMMLEKNKDMQTLEDAITDLEFVLKGNSDSAFNK